MIYVDTTRPGDKEVSGVGPGTLETNSDGTVSVKLSSGYFSLDAFGNVYTDKAEAHGDESFLLTTDKRALVSISTFAGYKVRILPLVDA